MIKYGWKPFLKDKYNSLIFLGSNEIHCPLDVKCVSSQSLAYKHYYFTGHKNEFKTGFRVFKTYEGAKFAAKNYNHNDIVILKTYYSEILHGGSVSDDPQSSTMYPIVIVGTIYVCSAGWFNSIKRFFKGNCV